MAEAALGAAQWVVGKALAPVADGVLGRWAATRNFGLNIEALNTELLLVNATLEQAVLRELGGPAMEMLLQKLRDLAHNAEDLLDELDYFRIHDELHGTYDAADKHGRSGIRNLALNSCHTVKAVGKHLASLSTYWFGVNADDPRQQDATQHANRSAWQHGRKRLRDDSSSAPNANQAGEEVSKRKKHRSLMFNRVDFSQRMNAIVEKLQLMRNEVNKILIHCGPKTITDMAQSRSITKGRIDEPKLYGRDHVMNSIIHDLTKGQYCDKGLTVLPIVGAGGMGKTTLIHHIYRNQQVQNHFPVVIWICVSLNFNLDKVLEQIKRYIPQVESEKECCTTEELIEQRLKSKRFLLVLDDIWQISNWDDWGKLLSTLNQSQEKGCMILVTTRFQAIAQKVKTTEHSIELNGLETNEFRKLFLAFVFGDEQCAVEKHFLLDTGDKIMEKLKGSPLAAKTVGRLLSKELSLHHWKRVLKSKEWEEQANNNDIMHALKLSYDFLPFHLQQCFFYSALFPEDYRFKSHQLISLWIGLDILIPSGEDRTIEDIGLSNLNELVIHGFFREEEMGGDRRYVMHDLLHDLALKVGSHDCLSLRLPNVGSVQIQPSTRHLSISTYGLDEYDAVSCEKLKSELEELKRILKVEHLQSLMLFGKMDECFSKIFGHFFREANNLRVLYLTDMMYHTDSMLNNFSELVHLRYLCLGTWERQVNLPLNISKFYHLRILDLQSWYGSRNLLEDISNLAKLCHFYVPSDDQLHSDIYNVGKLKLLEELKVFQVKKKSQGFEPKQLQHLTKLRELGIYNLEKIDTAEEAAQANLMEKCFLRKLTLDWDSKRSSVEPGVEAVVLESLQPHGDLQVLCIRGHGGPSCPTWLGDELAVEALQSLWLDGVSWDIFPSLGKAWDLHELRLENIARLKEVIVEKSFCVLIKLELIELQSFEKWVSPAEQESSLVGYLLPPDAYVFTHLQVLIIRNCPKLLGFPFSNHIGFPYCFPKLQELEIVSCPQFLSVTPISWIESLRCVTMKYVKLLDAFAYSKSSDGVELMIIGKGALHSLDQVLVFDKETGLEKLTLSRCPPLEFKHLHMLTSLKKFTVESSDRLLGQRLDRRDVKWQLPVEHITVWDLNGGQELTELLPHLPSLSKMVIQCCKKIKQLVVGVDLHQTTSTTTEMDEDEITATQEEKDGVLLFPTHLFDSLQELAIILCPELVLMDPPTLSTMRSLQRLSIEASPKFLSAFCSSRHIFPSSLQFLKLQALKFRALEPLSNLSSLTSLELDDCGHDLQCQGLQSLVTTGGQLKELTVSRSPRFFAGWDPNPGRTLEDVEGGEEQLTQLVSSTLQKLCTDDVAGLLAAPICSFLSSSLTNLELLGRLSNGMERFSKEQENALELLSSLQQLNFLWFNDLQQLPAGLRNITSLKKLTIYTCPAITSLPNDSLPGSLQVLDVGSGCNDALKQQCRGLMGTIPKIELGR